jgi:sortase (surface protein transpeptidase)
MDKRLTRFTSLDAMKRSEAVEDWKRLQKQKTRASDGEAPDRSQDEKAQKERAKGSRKNAAEDPDL